MGKMKEKFMQIQQRMDDKAADEFTKMKERKYDIEQEHITRKDKDYEEEDDSIWYSCCGVEMTGVLEDIGICPRCKEHTEREETINAMHDIAQNPTINQNKNDMKKVGKAKEVVDIKETKKETLKRLFIENNLVEEDVYKDKRGFVIITRTGIDKIVSKQNITIAYEPVIMERGWVVIKAVASMKVGDVPRNMMSFGEAHDDNLVGGGKKFPVAMAEKRAMSRVVSKVTGFYEQGVFGQDEIVD
mgnify:CR=1 FL=1